MVGINKKKLFLTVVVSRPLYGSLIYVKAIQPQRNVEAILAPQRVITISTESDFFFFNWPGALLFKLPKGLDKYF